MEFGFTKEQENLRKEIHEFYSNELPEDFEPDYANYNDELQEFWKKLVKKVVDRGYYVPGWGKGRTGFSFPAANWAGRPRPRIVAVWTWSTPVSGRS